MKIPANLVINGYEWSVEFDDDILEKREILGECDPDARTIKLSSTLKGNDLNSTFLHEVFHALVHEYSINQAIERSAEEIIVDVFSKFLIENFYVTPKRKLVE